MANNVILNAPTVGGGQTIATEDVGGVQFQRIKLALGGSGVDLGDVSNTNPLTVQMGGPSVGAFGDLIAQPLSPVVQLDFVYGINTQTGASTLANTGVAGTSNGRLELQTGVNSAGSAIFQSRKTAKYRPGQGMVARWTWAYTTGVPSSTQISGVGSSTNGYFLGYNGSTFGLLHRNSGSDTWVAQSSWNGDKCNGAGVSGFNLNPTFGNVFMVQYPYLGYGCVSFWVLNPATATWILAHVIQYPNTTTALQLSNPNMFFYAQVLNSGNTSNLTGYCGSVGFFAVGALSTTSAPRWAADNNKAAITAETNILSIRNCTTYNGVTNRSLIRINQITFANGTNTSTNIGTMRVRIGATVGGAPAFTPTNGSTADNGVTVTSGNSIASVDTAGTTSTGGTYVFNISTNNAGTNSVDVSEQGLVIAPGETMTFGGFATASSSQVVSVNWSEE